MIGKNGNLLFELAVLVLALISVIPRASAATVYVSNIEGSVSVINSTTNTITSTIPVGGTGIAISPDGKSAWVGGYYSGTVSVIDTATNVVTDTIPVGQAPWDTAFTPDGKTAYVTDEALNVVWVIDTASKAVVGSPIPLGTSEATEISVTPTGTFIYVVSICGNGPCFASTGTVSIIDTSTNMLVKTIPVGYFPNGIAMTPNGAFAYVANQCEDLSCASGGSVSVINTESQAITQTIPTGQFDSQFITIAPGGNAAYVANTCGDAFCSATGTVSTIDLTTNSIVGSPITVGDAPGELGVTPDGKFLYVVDQIGGVSVVATATNTVIATIPIGGHPAFLAITRPSFAGQPGKANCFGQSVSALSNQYGGLDAATSALGFASLRALQTAIREFCQG